MIAKALSDYPALNLRDLKEQL